MEPADCIVDLANVDALKLVNLAGLSKTSLVVHASVCVAKLAIDRLEEAELTPNFIHLHSILA